MLKPAPLFSSHCVLPMGKELRIFGIAGEGASVCVTLSGADGQCLSRGEAAAADGRFLCLLPAVDEPQTGCMLTVTCAGEVCRAEDVAIGLTFLAGGQSNMELTMWNAAGGRDIVSTHEDAGLRYFNVPKQSLWNDAAEKAEAASHWETIRPGTGADMSAVAYFFAARLRRQLHVPIGIVDCYWGGTSVTAWMDEECLLRTAEGTRYLTEYRAQVGDKSIGQWQLEEDAFQRDMSVWNGTVEALRAENPAMEWAEIERRAGVCPWNPPVGWGSPYRPGGLAETMLRRVTPAALTAFLYYQGEEDTARTTCYDQLLCSMVTRWRELFMDLRLPFLNLQLPMYAEKGAAEDYCWPVLRQAQQKAAELTANSSLTCLIDCGELGNIHPTDKRTPGERLADTYLAMTGDATAEARLCPRALRKAVLPGMIVITLDKPVRVTGGTADLFEIAGADGRFVPAAASIVGGTRIELTAEGLQHPVAARYAWVSYAVVHVFGENGAPLRPFLMQ